MPYVLALGIIIGFLIGAVAGPPTIAMYADAFMYTHGELGASEPEEDPTASW